MLKYTPLSLSIAIVILEVFQKKTQETPKQVIDNCNRRIKQYDS
jgi:phage-related protein